MLSTGRDQYWRPVKVQMEKKKGKGKGVPISRLNERKEKDGTVSLRRSVTRREKKKKEGYSFLKGKREGRKEKSRRSTIVSTLVGRRREGGGKIHSIA